jgi:hypothetical protein
VPIQTAPTRDATQRAPRCHVLVRTSRTPRRRPSWLLNAEGNIFSHLTSPSRCRQRPPGQASPGAACKLSLLPRSSASPSGRTSTPSQTGAYAPTSSGSFPTPATTSRSRANLLHRELRLTTAMIDHSFAPSTPFPLRDVRSPGLPVVGRCCRHVSDLRLDCAVRADHLFSSLLPSPDYAKMERRLW